MRVTINASGFVGLFSRGSTRYTRDVSERVVAARNEGTNCSIILDSSIRLLLLLLLQVDTKCA